MLRRSSMPPMAGSILRVAGLLAATQVAQALRTGETAHPVQLGVASGAPQFGALETCQAAYESLANQCNGNTMSAQPEYMKATGREGQLKHDEDGGSVISHGRTWGGPQNRRMLYKPPEGRTGMPSDVTGWDYNVHGEDWERLGECGAPGQSPIDLAKYIDIAGQTKFLLWFDYYLDPNLKKDKVARMVNDGHGLRYDTGANGVDLGFVKVGEEEYAASEYIFHAPSEHSMDGAVFPLELQVYNRAKSGAMIAIGIFFREGASNPFLASLMGSMGEAPRWTLEHGRAVGALNGTFPGAFDLEKVIPKGDVESERTFYNYQGSLTQPPCTTGVDWWVLSVPITATRDEIRFFRRAIFTSPSMRHGNARSTMPLNNRHIFVGLTGFQHSVKPRSIGNWSKDSVNLARGYDSGDMPWGDHWEPKGQGQDEVPAAAAAPSPGPASSPSSGVAASPSAPMVEKPTEEKEEADETLEEQE